jgi:hypothetical protein
MAGEFGFVLMMTPGLMQACLLGNKEMFIGMTIIR